MTLWLKNTIQNELAEIASAETVKRNTTLKSDYIYYLQSGLCLLEHISERGDSNVLLYFKEKSLMNFLPCLLKYTGENMFKSPPLDTEEYFIRSCTSCHLLKIESTALLSQLEKKPHLSLILIRALTQNYVNTLCLSTCITNQPAAIRISRIILEFSMQKEDRMMFPRHFTYNEISIFASLHVITVTKIFKALFREHIISKTGRQIFIERKEELEKIANKMRNLFY